MRGSYYFPWGERSFFMADKTDTENTPVASLDPAATDETTPNARDGARKRRDPNEPAAVVGLGASAGGIAALQQFFSDMPPESGLAFVVVMHLLPGHESNLAAVIQQKTKMVVMQVTEAVKVKPNHVYVIPPNHQLAFEEDTLCLVAPQQALGRRITIDLFFRALAMAFGQRAVCVVFSGSDSDGAIGVKHIRAQGGIVIAQEPSEAEYDSMPLMAINTGIVDWVLPVAEMAPKLMEFVRNEHAMRLPPEIEEAEEPDVKMKEAPGGETVSDETRLTLDESALGAVLDHLNAETGHDFTHYKRATILRRIARRLQVTSIDTIPKYLDFLRLHSAEVRALLQDMLIGVTHFFRDRESFAALQVHIPQLFASKGKEETVRAWVAGCSTGEEAYSIAMLLSEYAAKLPSPPAIQVFASDIDEQAIAEARSGLFPATIEADLSQERLRRFFARDQGRYRVRKALREKVLFSAHNVLSHAPFSRVDLISCRNLLIYLKREAQQQVFDTFHFSLRSGGLLFIGSAESSAVEGLFSPIDAKHRIYVRRSVPRPVWKLPGLPVRAAEPTLHGRVTGRSQPLPMLGKSTMEDASTMSDEAGFRGQERRAALFGELHLKLLEQYAPPSIVVNEEHDVVHLSDKAGRYLRFAAGEPSMNLFRIINPALQIELRTALFRASQGEEANVTSAPQTVQIEGRTEVITLQVRRIASAPAEKYFLVLFEVRPDLAPQSIKPSAEGDVTRSLEDEIEYLKQQLSATVEQYEASNEELKASNEELHAMNEELRSATEELETNKEELQSVNEELSTVNSELKSSVEELSSANSDLNNLMASTDIGTVFLDRQLRILRFTPSAQMVFNLLPADLGRPLADITHKLHYDSLIPDAEEVLDRLATIENEVPLDDGKRWLLVRIAPYRTADDRISGVVATFIDITLRRRAEENLHALSAEAERHLQRFNTVMSAVPDFVYQFDLEGRFTYINQSLLDLWKKTYDEAIGRNFHELDYPTELATKLQHQIQEVIRRVAKLRDETPYTSAIGTRMYEYIFFPLLAADGKIDGVGGVTRDITERRHAEEKLRESEERFRNVADNVPQVIWTNTPDGNADYFNRRWFEYTGLTYEESAGPGWQAIVHPEEEASSTDRWTEALRKGETFDAEYRLRGKNGAYRWFIGRNVPLRANGAILGWFGTATDIEDLKRARTKLEDAEEKFRLLVEGTPDYAMFLLNPENVITYWSSGARKVFGWSAEEAVGQSGTLIFVPEDEAKGAVEMEIGIAREQGYAPDRRWHLRRDGTRVWIDGVMRRIDHSDGALRGFAKIARDATDLHAAEEKLREAHDQLEKRVRDRTRELEAMNETLEQEMTQRQMLERQILKVTERERARISQDLHDSLCQDLTATAFLLKSRAKATALLNEEAAVALREAAETVNAGAGLARDLARGLHPFELGTGGLVNALRELATRTNDTVSCRCECPRSLRVPNEEVALNLYRIAQEAVLNAVKHAHATEIVICIGREANEITLVISDNGTARRPSKHKRGMGIHLMQYRANVSGGSLQIERERGGGTKVKCRVPAKQ
ncbi:MAG: PAS domain S-box protein [Verrucomicrobiota bacterium]|nr:PAS domain S-box protein [Verrucomicrobiota bacterium]